MTTKTQGYQTIKFRQLTETFFLRNYTQDVVEKLFPDPFLKNQTWAYLNINSLKFYTVRFYSMPN